MAEYFDKSALEELSVVLAERLERARTELETARSWDDTLRIQGRMQELRYLLMLGTGRKV